METQTKAFPASLTFAKGNEPAVLRTDEWGGVASIADHAGKATLRGHLAPCHRLSSCILSSCRRTETG